MKIERNKREMAVAKSKCQTLWTRISRKERSVSVILRKKPCDPCTERGSRQATLRPVTITNVDHELVENTDKSSVSATFAQFTLRLNRLADHWTLTTSPAESPVEIKIDLPGRCFGLGELIHPKACSTHLHENSFAGREVVNGYYVSQVSSAKAFTHS